MQKRSGAMRRIISHWIWSALILGGLVSNNLLSCFAGNLARPITSTIASSILNSHTQSASLTPINEGHDLKSILGVASSSLTKTLSSSSSTLKSQGKQQFETRGLSPQAFKGPFNSVDIVKGALRFKLSKPAGSFTEPVSATINGLAFTTVEIKKKGRNLFLKGITEGQALESLFPDGGTVAITIINGDGMRSYMILTRQGSSVSILTPAINNITPGHGTPSSTITISGSNFSSNPGYNVIIYRTSDSKEFRVPATEATQESLTTIVPLIPLANLNSFYSGLVTVSVETAPAYSSNTNQLTIDPLPRNSMPTGMLSQEYSQRVEELISGVEDRISGELTAQGIKIEVIQVLRELPHAGLDFFRSIIDDAVAGHPQTFLIDHNGDGVVEPVKIDKDKIDIFERMLISSGVSTTVASTFANLSTKTSIVSDSECPLTEQERQVLSASRSYQQLDASSSVIDAASILAAAAGNPEISFLFEALNFWNFLLQVEIGSQHIKLFGVEAGPSLVTIPSGETRRLLVSGRFGPVVHGLTVREAIKYLMILKLDSLGVHGLVKTIILKAIDALLGFASSVFRDRLNQFISQETSLLPLSANTTSVQLLSNPSVSLGELCAGTILVTGLSETSANGVPFQITANFPLAESDASRNIVVNP
jgi:hypothetical protein